MEEREGGPEGILDIRDREPLLDVSMAQRWREKSLERLNPSTGIGHPQRNLRLKPVFPRVRTYWDANICEE
jgi:hypothetical protein